MKPRRVEYCVYVFREYGGMRKSVAGTGLLIDYRGDRGDPDRMAIIKLVDGTAVEIPTDMFRFLG